MHCALESGRGDEGEVGGERVGGYGGDRGEAGIWEDWVRGCWFKDIIAGFAGLASSNDSSVIFQPRLASFWAWFR